MVVQSRNPWSIRRQTSDGIEKEQRWNNSLAGVVGEGCQLITFEGFDKEGKSSGITYFRKMCKLDYKTI